MARPLRIEFPNAFYHVMNRGLNRQSIYRADNDYEMFLSLLRETSRFFGVRFICYCLMSNHYHLLLQTPKANLSRVMRHLNGVYTQRFNIRHKKDGPLFRGRYKAILVQADEYLTHLIRYIHLNPVQASLVRDLSNYRWTSHSDYIGEKTKSDWLSSPLGLSFFSNKLKQAVGEYRNFLSQGVDLKTRSFYSQKKQGPIFGDPDFIERIRETYVLSDEKLSSEITEKRGLEGLKMADRISRATAGIFQVHLQTLGASRRGEANYARMAAVNLTRELSGLKLAEIAEYYGMKSYKSVGTSCHRFKARLPQDSHLNRRYDELQRACSQGET